MAKPAPLADTLRARIQADGPLAFSEWMEACLYHHEHGYYAQATFTTGRQGDFATAPDAGPLMGRTLAQLVETFAREPGRLIEVGPGSGRLMGDILDALSPEALDHLELGLVEPFEQRHAPLHAELESHPVEAQVLQSTDELDPARTLLLANELLDALPTDIVRRDAQGWEQLAVTMQGDGFAETWQPATDAVARFADEHASQLPDGHRYEASPAIGEMLASMARVVDPGCLVLFDYGGRFRDIWPQRETGTLRAFHDHQHVDPLSAPGRCDLTFDVDFTMVQREAARLELDTVAFGPQENLLVHLGLVDQARASGEMLAIKQLVVPGSFAGRFQALVLDRGALASELDLKVDLQDPSIWERAGGLF